MRRSWPANNPDYADEQSYRVRGRQADPGISVTPTSGRRASPQRWGQSPVRETLECESSTRSIGRSESWQPDDGEATALEEGDRSWASSTEYEALVERIEEIEKRERYWRSVYLARGAVSHLDRSQSPRPEDDRRLSKQVTDSQDVVLNPKEMPILASTHMDFHPERMAMLSHTERGDDPYEQSIIWQVGPKSSDANCISLGARAAEKQTTAEALSAAPRGISRDEDDRPGVLVRSGAPCEGFGSVIDSNNASVGAQPPIARPQATSLSRVDIRRVNAGKTIKSPNAAMRELKRHNPDLSKKQRKRALHAFTIGFAEDLESQGKELTRKQETLLLKHRGVAPTKARRRALKQQAETRFFEGSDAPPMEIISARTAAQRCPLAFCGFFFVPRAQWEPVAQWLKSNGLTYDTFHASFINAAYASTMPNGKGRRKWKQADLGQVPYFEQVLGIMRTYPVPAGQYIQAMGLFARYHSMSHEGLVGKAKRLENTAEQRLAQWNLYTKLFKPETIEEHARKHRNVVRVTLSSSFGAVKVAEVEEMKTYDDAGSDYGDEADFRHRSDSEMRVDDENSEAKIREEEFERDLALPMDLILDADYMDRD